MLVLTLELFAMSGSLKGQSNGETHLNIEAYPLNSDVLVYLFASGSHSTNFVLQSAPGLTGWTNVFHSYGHPSVDQSIYSRWLSQPLVFWRAIPGISLDAQKQRWIDEITKVHPKGYSFRLRHMINYSAGGVRGTVQVHDGKIVEITDAVDDQTGQPIANPDLSKFATITELYDKIRLAFETDADQVRVNYDASQLFPTKVVVDWLAGFADDEEVFEVSDLVFVE